MDIQYLLWLQDIRNALGGSLDEVFNGISKTAVDLMPLLPFLIYWCVSKKWGWRFLITFWCGELLNGLIKLTVCAYRPWIRSELIEPAGDSKVAATGYSFPSGHTVCATSTYGLTAVWQYKKRRWLAVVCGVLVLLTAFSRNFLGVHTPQDVVVGFLESVLLIALVGWVMDKYTFTGKQLDLICLAGIAVLAASLVYVHVKPYPMDYVDGVLLVDPKNMLKDIFGACGGMCGLIVGGYIDRHYIHFEIPKNSPNLPVVTAVGLGIVFAWRELFSSATVVLMFGRDWGNFVSKMLCALFVLVLYPLVIRKYCPVVREKAEKAEKPANAGKAVNAGKAAKAGGRKNRRRR